MQEIEIRISLDLQPLEDMNQKLPSMHIDECLTQILKC